MSYCRVGEDSDVYVISDVSHGVPTCYSCGIIPLYPKDMVLHLIQHIRDGDKVPDRAFQRLLNEIEDGTYEQDSGNDARG